ncbi:MAG: RagB/SusD family nutrient uptake outer membrane protein [Muribaculaceae bacterium]|nr:RagB/SusD family nutrient uptake outer membrane protein [Muribaculaceae bacterium]
MKKHTDFLRTVFVLLTLLCMTATAAAQNINAPATVNESEEGAVQMLKAGNIPMQKRLGDVNLDGSVSIADVTALIDMLLTGTPGSNADVNADGNASIADVTALIDMLLTGSAQYDLVQAQSALDDIYYSMRMAGWTTPGNTHQTFGISAYNLMAEVMGDDMIMGAQGSGWFWYDAAYNVKERYTSTSWRSADLWNAYYTWIANANYILAACQSITSSANYVRGQAYAIRAYSYFMLAQSFARTYKGHENDPCVPIFDGKTFNGSTGKLRSTVTQVYAQIESDINEAVNLLNGTTQQNPSHIGYAVALGLRSRIYLVEEKWSSAYLDAKNAITELEAAGKGILEVEDFKGLNDVSKSNVMWGCDIPDAEVGMYASLWAHMCTNIAYGQRAPKQINKWLYNKMSSTDARRAWWKTNDTGVGSDALVQDKFNTIEGSDWGGDYIWMRVEEMYLNAAEALAHRGNFDSNARNYLNQLMAKRDPNYSCNKSGNDLGALTNDETGSLLEEILIQRRLELWGEDGRIYTIRRLRQGFERNTEDGWPASLTLPSRSLSDPESYPWVLTIPLAEYYNYYARMILDVDQNPIGDYPSSETPEIERTPQHLSFWNTELNLEISASTSSDLNINVYRKGTCDKRYYALLCLTDEDNGSKSWDYVIFEPGQSSSDVTLTFNGEDMALGRHTYTLSLTDLEVSVANSSQLTSMKILVDVMNFESEGQHISFETANQDVVLYTPGYIEVPVTLTRAVTTHDYRAHVTISDQTNPDNIILSSENVFFAAGVSTATTSIRFYDMEIGNTYSCVLTLSDEDIATADPSLGEQITSTTVTVQVKTDDDIWEPAGSCTFTDYFYINEGNTAYEVPIQRNTQTGKYRIVSPLSAAFSGLVDNPCTNNWFFTLNTDGSISPEEGTWDLFYTYQDQNLNGYYDTTRYPTYCYVEQDGNTYDVNFLLSTSTSLYSGGNFIFTWDR